MPRPRGTRLTPTPRALCLAALGAGLVAAAIYLGRPELAGIGSFLVLLPLLAAGWAVWRSRRGPAAARLARSVSGEPRAGERLEVSVSAPGSAMPAGREDLPDFSPTSLRHRGGPLSYAFTPPTRGRYRLGPFRSRGGDRFGLVRERETIPGRLDLTVLPTDSDDLAAASAEAAAHLAALRAHTDVSPDSLTRPYRQGDPLRRVHWGMTARQDRLMVRPDAPEPDEGSALLLDRTARHYPGPTRTLPNAGEGFASDAAFETAVALVARLSGDDEAVPVSVPAHRAASAPEWLATVHPADAADAAWPRRAGGVIVTGTPGEAAAAWPSAWRGQRVHVLWVAPASTRLAEPVRLAWERAGWTQRRVEPLPLPDPAPPRAWAPAAPSERARPRTAALLGAAVGALRSLVVVASAALPVLSLLITGRDWLAPAALALLAVVAAGFLARGVLRRGWVAWLLQPLVAAGAWIVCAIEPHARWGVVPAPGFSAAARESLVGLGALVRDDIAPVRPLPEVVAVLVLATALIAWVTDAALNSRSPRPLLAALPLGLAAVGASFAIERPLGPWVLAGLAVGFLVLLLAPRARSLAPPAGGSGAARRFAPVRLRAAAPTAAIAALALVGSLTLPAALLPDPYSGVLPPGTRLAVPGGSSGVDPLLDLSRDLRSPIDRTVLRYTTNSAEPVYLRTSVVENLFGETWGPATEPRSAYTSGRELGRPGEEDPNAPIRPLPAHVPTAESMTGTGYGPEWLRAGFVDDYLGEQTWPPRTTEAKRRADQRVGLDAFGYSAPWLPVPSQAAAVTDLPSSYAEPAGSGTLLQSKGISIAGGTFSATISRPVQPKNLRASPPLSQVAAEAADGSLAPVSDDGTLQEAAGSAQDRERIPASIRDLSNSVVERAGAEGNPSAIADALKSYLLSSGFTYSERAPITDGSSTGGLSMVEKFLESKSGYCVHYAASMVLLARSQGIPARLALGYAPGTPTGRVAEVAGVKGKEYTVSSRNAHAWAQLYFVGVGWVDVDATPGRSASATPAPLPAQTPATADPTPQATAATQGTQAAEDPRPSRGGASSAAASTGPSSASAAAPQAGAGPGAAPPFTPPAWLLPVLGGLAAVGAALGGLAAWRAARRRRLRAEDAAAYELAWSMVARAARRRSRRDPALTAPAQAAAWFPSGPEHEAAQRLAAGLDRARYAPAQAAPTPGGGRRAAAPRPAATRPGAARPSDAAPAPAPSGGPAAGLEADVELLLASLRGQRH